MLKINMISASGVTFKLVSDISSGDIVKVAVVGGAVIISCVAIKRDKPIKLHFHIADKEADISIGNGQISLNGKNVLQIDSATEKALSF